ncbi:MAG: glycosyltransferase [Clostridia bacterium]|nr:glycosyltransferase [Clostridia bacterium]
MEKPIISIIVLCYNNFEYIFQCLNSVVSQKYEKIQLIVSDDASSLFDKTKVTDYINKNKGNNIVDFIVNVNIENLGTVKHLENIHNICTGDLITVIAADDAYADDLAISSLIDLYLHYNGDVPVITSLLAMCDERLEEKKSIFTSPQDVALINSGSKRGLLDELSYRCFIPSSGTIIHKNVYKTIGSLSDKYNYVEDWTSHIRIVRCGIKIRCLNRITIFHRDGGISHGNTRAHNRAYLSYYQDILNIYLNEVLPYSNQISEYALRRAEQYYIWRLARQKQDLLKDKKQNCQKIVFYCRKGMIAQGDFSLYYRVGQWLAKEDDIAVYCVNNKNGELKKQFLDSDMFFCDLNTDNLSEFKDAIFVTSYNQFFFLLDDIKELKNARIVLLFMHPQVSDWLSAQAFFNSFKLQQINEMLVENKAYGMMDGSNYLQLQERCPNVFKPLYFPVIKEECKTDQSSGELINHFCINMAWLGRLDGDKVQSLIYFLDNAFESIDDLKMNVHLIGDGNSKDKIEFNKYAGKIHFTFNSFLYGEMRDNYLVRNADFVVAMGVSAIDVAKLAIPTLVPIISNTRIREDKFVYIYDIKDYSLGWDSHALQNLGCETHTAQDILNDIFYNNLKRKIGLKCRDYVNKEFSINKHLVNAKKILTSTELTVEKCFKNQTVKNQLMAYSLYKKFINKHATYAVFLEFNNKVKNLRQMKFTKQIKIIFSWVLKKS